MKKFFYVAAALLAAGFVSCSENNNDALNAPVAGTSDLAPIRFDINSGRVNIEQKSAATRGTGAVGDIATGNNVWNGEELKVYMFEKGTLNLALDKTATGQDAQGNDYSTMPLFDNASIFATAGATLVETPTQKYYPMQGNFDFFAYHVDNAATVINGEAAIPTLNVDKYIIPVTIDGSQDLMVAKAELTTDQEALLPAEKANNYYSAFSARKGVNPHFTFQHLLTRLTFEVKAATTDDEAVVIKGVEIDNANTTADMVVAYTAAPAELLDNQANPATVSLKDANGAAFAETNPSAVDFNRIGESLMLMPQAEYNMIIRMTQTVNGVERTVDYPYTLKSEKLGLTSFEAGKQYNVKFTVYGLSVIKLELELTAWKDGGDLEVDDNEI